jgi:hypothetical protein
MPKRDRLILLGLAALVVVVGVTVAATRGGGGDGPKTVSAATVDVVGAKPQGGLRTIRFKKGSTIDLTIHSDTADEIHFHGYDVHKDVARGGTAVFEVPATIAGRFVVELEGHKQPIATVEVVP